MTPKTKIVCTIGPASQSPEVIRDLIAAGMSVARLNFNHGTHEEHLAMIQTIRRISEDLNKPVAILQDFCGPKIRVDDLPEEGVLLEYGKPFVLTNRSLMGDQDRVSVS